MGIFSENRRASNVEVHVRAVGAYACGGETMTLFPELPIPSSKSASGMISTIHIATLFIEDLVPSGQFRSVILSCDGANANRADVRMLTSELRKRDKLLIFTSICNAHAANNATRWSLGKYPYGSMLRSSHAFDDASDRGIFLLVDRNIQDMDQQRIPALADNGEVDREFPPTTSAMELNYQLDIHASLDTYQT